MDAQLNNYWLGCELCRLSVDMVVAPFCYKGSFFSESALCFLNLPKNIPNHYPALEIRISCLLIWAGNSNSKFRILIWNIFFIELTSSETIGFALAPNIITYLSTRFGIIRFSYCMIMHFTNMNHVYLLIFLFRLRIHVQNIFFLF